MAEERRIPQTVLKVLGKLDRVRKSGEGWLALCPSHKDSEPSLTVGIGSEGRALLNCHRGCPTEKIVEAAGLSMTDLFPPPAAKNTFVESYPYTDEHGTVLYEVIRWLKPDGRKTFTQRRPDGAGGWIYALGDTPRPLYRLPKVLRAIGKGDTVYVVEGEKDVHYLETMGLVATTNSGGAKHWLDSHAQWLKGANVVVVADNDDVGKAHAFQVGKSIDGLAKSVKLLVPPNGYKDLSDMVKLDNPIGKLLPLKEASAEILESAEPGYYDPDPELPLATGFDPKKDYSFSTQARMVTWEDFLREVGSDDYDWIIPGVLERQERVMVVAPEGVGKSMLARQVAILSAAGLHPFQPTNRMPPIRTLTIDLENPERIIRRTSRKIIEKVRWSLSGRTGEFQAHLVPKPDGMDLLQDKDREIFEQFVAAASPDVLFIGPLYKTFIDPGGRTAESIATEVARFFDYIRAQYNTALWIEHHAPLGGDTRYLRPFGSAVWSRWSEFGLAIYPDPTQPYQYDIKHYRGMRDARAWPKVMKRGDLWPFEVIEFYDT